MEDKVVLALSGGLDSTTLAYKLVKDYGKDNVTAITFSYCQRHDVELEQSKRTAKELGISHKIIDISFLGEMVQSVSSMVKGEVDTPEAEEDDMPSSYVPFRNAIFSMLIASYAETVGANIIALGLNVDQPDNEDYKYRYWDITPEFYEAIGNVLALNRKNEIKFIAPFISLSKVEEIELAKELKVKFENTWTCYNPVISADIITFQDEPAGGKNKVTQSKYEVCGTCPSCFERANAFKSVGMIDPVAEKGVIC